MDLRAATRSVAMVSVAMLGVLPVVNAQGGSVPSADARTWIGRSAEFEAYLRSAPVVRTENTDRGVHTPVRAFFESGGPLGSMTWKALPPGRTGGYFESYKSEIAAYAIDRMLGLDMVPPKVERELEGETGVAVMWVEGARTFADIGRVPKAPPAKAPMWNRQMRRAKMFHNLIGDIDPNLGNWLVDSDWHLILIDHSRAFTTDARLTHEMQQIDEPLWQHIHELTRATLAGELSQWLDAGQIDACARAARSHAGEDRSDGEKARRTPRLRAVSQPHLIASDASRLYRTVAASPLRADAVTSTREGNMVMRARFVPGLFLIVLAGFPTAAAAEPISFAFTSTLTL